MTGKAFVINGYGGVGKGEFVDACIENLRYYDKYCEIFKKSMIDEPKEIAERLCWDKKKDDRGREFLADLKRSIDKYSEDYLVDEMVFACEILIYCDDLVFIDARETKDIEKLKKRLNAKAILVTNNRVKCPECKSDQEIMLDGYDYVIENNGTLKELKQKAKEFMEGLND